MSKKLLGMAPLSSKRDNSITQMHIGGDDHDYLPHGNAKCAHHREAFETFKVTHNKMYGSYEGMTLSFLTWGVSSGFALGVLIFTSVHLCIVWYFSAF